MKTKSFMNGILVTSAGSGVGEAILKAASLSSSTYQLHALNSDALKAELYEFDSFTLSALTQQKASFIQDIFKAVDKYQPKLLLAGRDEELTLLAEIRPQLAQQGCIVPCGSNKQMETCSDKYKTWTELHSELPIVPTASTDHEVQELIQKFHFPLVLKPRRGFASKDIEMIKDSETLHQRLQAHQQDMIVQPLLKSARTYALAPHLQEFSGQIILGREGQFLGSFATRFQNIQGFTGKLLRLRSDSPFALSLNQWGQTLGQLGFRGALNLQAIETRPNEFQIIEINARCTGLTGVRAQMGFNEVDLLYDHFVLKQQTTAPTWDNESLATLSLQYKLLPLEQF